MNKYLEKAASLTGSIKRGLVTLRQASGSKMRKFESKHVINKANHEHSNDAVNNFLKKNPVEWKDGGYFPKNTGDELLRLQRARRTAESKAFSSGDAYHEAARSHQKAKAKVDPILRNGAKVAGGVAAATGAGVLIAKMRKKNKVNE